MPSFLNIPFVSLLRKAGGGALALTLAFAVSSPALATDFSFDFVNRSYTNSATNKQTFSASGGVGSTPLFTRTVGATAIQLQLSAWYLNTTTNKTASAVLNFYTGGIGITDPNETATSPNHSIDNNNGVDFLVLQFSKPVNLASINIGWIYNDSDVTIRYGDAPGAWNVLPVLNNVGVGATGGLNSMLNPKVISSNGGTTTGSRSTPNGGLSDFWIISAANPNPLDGGQAKADYLKLSQIVVSEFPPLPEPSTWMTMIVGFGTVAWAMRRSRKSAALPGDTRRVA